MEIHAHGFLLLVVFFWRGLSRILRGILDLAISGSQPLTIELRHWPQTWRRAVFCDSALLSAGRVSLLRSEAFGYVLFPLQAPSIRAARECTHVNPWLSQWPRCTLEE